MGILIAMALAVAQGLGSGCTKYEVVQVYEPEILLVEAGETERFRVAMISSHVLEDSEGLLRSYRPYLFDGLPPDDPSHLKSTIQAMPPSRRIAGDARQASLPSVASAMLRPEDRGDASLRGEHWFLVANDPVALAQRAAAGRPAFTEQDILFDCAFITASDLDTTVDEVIVLPWSWARILNVWRSNDWSVRESMIQASTDRMSLEEPQTLRAVLEAAVNDRLFGSQRQPAARP